MMELIAKSPLKGCGDIADVVGGQFAGVGLVGIGIKRDVQYPLASARSNPVLLIHHSPSP
ncbi:hypothetical protein [Acidiphilium sp.]|uniref:hypothetical protein n=1 Tax=Acidiphilium sp. TaxID=527 RepID=UPI003CFFAB13